jgi:hypothetical protein
MVSKLNGAPADKINVIGKSLSASSVHDYANKLAHEYTRQKVKNTKLPFEQLGEAYVLDDTYFVLTSSGQIQNDLNKSSIVQYARNLRAQTDVYEGIIHFLPFQMNGKRVREVLQKELPIDFVNIPVNPRFLEAKYKAHILKQYW